MYSTFEQYLLVCASPFSCVLFIFFLFGLRIIVEKTMKGERRKRWIENIDSGLQFWVPAVRKPRKSKQPAPTLEPVSLPVQIATIGIVIGFFLFGITLHVIADKHLELPLIESLFNRVFELDLRTVIEFYFYTLGTYLIGFGIFWAIRSVWMPTVHGEAEERWLARVERLKGSLENGIAWVIASLVVLALALMIGILVTSLF